MPDIHLHVLRGGWSSTARRLGIDRATWLAQLNHKSARVHAGYTRIGRPNDHERDAAARVVRSFTPASVLRQTAPDHGAEALT